MKNLFAVLGILLLIAAAIVFSLRFRDAAAVKSATVSEQAGNYGDALSGYVKALNALLPGSALPDVNRSKVLVPDAWKKEMAVFCHSLSAPGRPVNKEKRQTILGGILRNAGRVHQHNMLNDPSEKPLSPEQYSAIWNTAFFAPTVAVNPGQQELIDASYATPLSLIKFSALTTYTYDVMLVDTTTNRQTTFTVYPENSTV
nr:hypothetical protein [Chitinispirillaceae bacterium]